MQRRDIKDHIRESRNFSHRSAAALVLVVILVSVILGRLVYLQVANYEHYTTQAQNNRVKIIPVAPTRGLIYDRNGVILAQNQTSFTLEIIPEKVDDLEVMLAELRSIISVSDADIERFYRDMERQRRFDSVPLRYWLTDDEVAKFSVVRYRFSGVTIKARLVRHYTYGQLTTHVLGYVARINEKEQKQVDESNYSATNYIGKTGVEKYYETQLHGQVGYEKIEANVQGRVLRTLERTVPVAGDSLNLTLDIDLQIVASQALNKYRGAVVAIKPETGEILAFVSMPSYDPNQYTVGFGHTAYKALLDSPDRPLFNRALRGRYPPGSTVKPFVGLAGLQFKEARQEVYCPGWFSLEGDDHRYRDWKQTGHDMTSLKKAIVESCDVYFYDLALRLGIDRISPFMKQFGFGLLTEVDISGELSGLMPSRQWKRAERHRIWFPGETLITGIGQGFMLSTPLQLASSTAALANNGIQMKPYIVASTSVAGRMAPIVKSPELLHKVTNLNESNMSYIISAMRSVVHSSTGSARKISHNLTYDIAGKTGTSQVFGIKQDEVYIKEEIAEKLRDHALFIAFAPVEHPKIAIAVVVENGGSGGDVAAPIARQVMDAYLKKQ
ncbi:MAG TPA: penicillin-binding protein 2 [Gammaproteobacteria bacterium]|nr:penicillin-binding protein 2 [Gammaproteobacteria bacterium]